MGTNKRPTSFNTKKIVANAGGGSYNTKYLIYEEEGFDKERTYKELLADIESGRVKGKENFNTACYAGFRDVCKKGSNRILVKVAFPHGPKAVQLSAAERKKWVNLCKYHGLMPEHIGRHFLETGNFIMKFEDLTLTKIFLTLNTVRHMQEYQQVPLATIYLRSLGLNFFLAMLAATKCTCAAVGHSIYKQGKSYGVDVPSISNTKVNPQEALALKEYVRKPCATDNKPLKEFLKKGKHPGYFKLQTTVQGIMKELKWKPGFVTVPALFDDKIQDMLRK